MSCPLRSADGNQANTSLLCRRIDKISEKASALDRQHKATQVIVADLLAEIIKDLESDLSWYMHMFTVRAALSGLTFRIDIGSHQGFASGNHT